MKKAGEIPGHERLTLETRCTPHTQLPLTPGRDVNSLAAPATGGKHR